MSTAGEALVYLWATIAGAILMGALVGLIPLFLARSKGYPYLILEDDGMIRGYAYAHPFSGREAYYRSVEVTIYLRHGDEHKGYGKLLYEELEKRLKQTDIHNLYAIVMYPGYGSVEFHEKLGYSIVGKLTDCGEKFGKLWSVVYMEKRI